MLIDKALYTRIQAKKKELDSLRPFPKAALLRLKQNFDFLATYNSNAIEGNTLTLSETRLVVEEGITIGGKSMREHFEAINHKHAIDFIDEFVRKKVRLNKDFLCRLNCIILNEIEDDEKGIYRKRRVWIEGASFVPAMPSLVPKLMKNYFAWLGKNKRKLNPVELAAIAHEKFVFIHPFIDGNGRIARLLTNVILMQDGYPPAIILKIDRKKYIRALERAHNDDYAPFVNFIARAVERSLVMYLEALKTSGHEEYVSLSEATRYCGYSQEYLSLLARKGRLEAVKFGRNWMTTKRAVKDYLKGLDRQ